jgi:hypothetical protein
MFAANNRRSVLLNCVPAGPPAARSTLVSSVTRGVTLPRPRGLVRLPPGFGSVPFSMPHGLITGRPFNPFNPFSQRSHRAAPTRCRSANSPNSLTTRASNSARGRPGKSAGGDIPQRNVPARAGGRPKYQQPPGFCPDYVGTWQEQDTIPIAPLRALCFRRSESAARALAPCPRCSLATPEPRTRVWAL